MSQPPFYGVIDDGDKGETGKCSVSQTPITAPVPANMPVTVWRPVIVRVVLGGLALMGLAGVGAASMLTGLDGARANPPTPGAAHIGVNGPAATSSAVSVRPAQSGIPAVGQAPSSAASPQAASLQDACVAGRTPDGKVILNLATMADLRTLPNIGQKRAQAILTLRDKLKKFHRVQELRRVKGIGAKTLRKLSPKLLIDPPAGSCAPAAGDPVKKM